MNAAPPVHPFAAGAAAHWRAGLRYGLLGLPLAFAALPMYVVLPHHYAQHHGLALASIGVLLMLVRLCDAFLEPLLGRWCDALYARSLRTVLWVAGAAAALLALGLTGLYFPPPTDRTGLWVWMLVGLVLTSVAHSQLILAHQAWGVRLGGDAVQRSRIVAWREGHALVGVVAASALALTWGAAGMLAVFGVALACGYLLWWQAPRPAPLGGCRTLGVESENAPQRDQFLPDSPPHSGTMGQEDGKKWAAAAHSQPTTPKPDRFLGACRALGRLWRSVPQPAVDLGDGGFAVAAGEGLQADA